MKKIIYTLFLMFAATAFYAQSADVVTEILSTSEVNFGQICYLSAIQQGYVNDDATYEASINALYENSQLPGVVYPETPIVMVDLAFIYSKTWDVKGGLFYTITGGSPRYAFKQLKADGVISAKADPSDTVTGAEALNILTACQFTYGGMTLDNMGE